MIDTYNKSVEEVTYDILERIFPKGYDLDARLVEDVKEIITKYRLSLIDAEIERVEGIDDEKCDNPECQKEHEYPYIIGRQDMKDKILTHLKEQRERL